MELSLTDRLTRTEQPVQTERKKSGGTGAAALSRGQTRTDRVSLSKQAVAYLEEQRRLHMGQLEGAAGKARKEAAGGKSGEEAGLEALGEYLKATMKCMEIARRIMRGDKVPPQDERYLMENDPEGYKLAVAARTPKKKPKEWDSILDDEDENGGSGDNRIEGTGEAGGTAASPEGARSGSVGGAE